MTKWVVIDRSKVRVNDSGLKFVKPPTINFTIEVDLPPEVHKELDKDPLLQQEFNAHASKVLEQTIDTIERKCKVFDKLFTEQFDAGADPKLVQKNLDGLNRAIQEDIAVARAAAAAGVKDIWDDLKAARKEWKKFKAKIAVSMLGTAATLAVSIASLVVTGFSGGASGAFAIIGFIKVGVRLAQDIKRIAIDIDGARKEVIGHLEVVEAAAKKSGVYEVNEVSAAVFNEFLGISQPSIKSCQTTAETFKAKYKQLVVKVHDLSKNLNKALEAQKSLEADFMAEAEKLVKKHPTSDKTNQLKKIERQLDKALEDSKAKVNQLIIDIGELYTDVTSWAPKVKEVEKRLRALEMRDPAGLRVFREGLKFATMGLAALDGNKLVTATTSIAFNVGAAAGGYVYDKVVSKALDGTVLDAA